MPCGWSFGSSTLRVRPRRSPPSEPACAACSMRATLSCLLVSFFPFPPSCISLLAQQPSRARSISEFRNLRGNGRQARPGARTGRGARVQDGRRPCKTSGGRMDGTVTLAGNQRDGFELEKGSLRGGKKTWKGISNVTLNFQKKLKFSVSSNFLTHA